MRKAPRGGWRRFGPLALLVTGAVLLVPAERVQRWVQRGSELLLTGRVLDPRAFLAEEVAAAADAAGPSPWVVRRLEETRRALFPPASWATDGSFHAVAVGAHRSGERLELALFGEVPPDEPVLLGDHPVRGGRDTVLIGFTRQQEGRRAEVIPITSTSFRAAALAGSPGRGEGMSFVAQGDGGEMLSVQAARSLHGLNDGDLVWVDPAFAEVLPGAWQPPQRSILVLGTLWRDPAELEVDRAFHVIPAWTFQELREVVIRFPPGFPDPGLLAWRGRRVPVIREGIQDRGRSSWILGAGRERGFLPGAAVASGEALVGEIVQSGYGVALLRGVTDPGFEARVFLVTEDECTPWVLRVKGTGAVGVRLDGPPPPAHLDGATVATTFSSELVPPGLLIGTLRQESGSWWLVPSAPVPAAVSVFVPQSGEESG